MNWLAADDADGVARMLRGGGWIAADERVLSVARAGEGNMNLVLRVITDRQRLIVKQSRPWVEKYPSIAAPVNRLLHELRFYETVGQSQSASSGSAHVSALMPRLIGADPEQFVLILEDLGEASDCTTLYRSVNESDVRTLIVELVTWLNQLHAIPVPDAERHAFANRELRQLNHAHIFEIPFASVPALDLDAITPGLEAVTRPLRHDQQLKRSCDELGARYLAEGPSLLHGDFYPGSWLMTAHGCRVIDPEFCFCGPPEIDWGVMAAHLRMMPHAFDAAELRAFASAVDWSLVERFAAMEVLRRLLGVAQLPLVMSLADKASLIEAAVCVLRGA